MMQNNDVQAGNERHQEEKKELVTNSKVRTAGRRE
jgi:hypothetical protein